MNLPNNYAYYQALLQVFESYALYLCDEETPTLEGMFARFPKLWGKLLRRFDGDWRKLAEDCADDPVATQAIKDEIARRLSDAGPATS